MSPDPINPIPGECFRATVCREDVAICDGLVMDQVRAKLRRSEAAKEEYLFLRRRIEEQRAEAEAALATYWESRFEAARLVMPPGDSRVPHP
jgi:hypothetical protein